MLCQEIRTPMLTPKAAIKIIKKLPDLTMKDHFGSDAFCAKKKIFATVWHEKNEVNIRLNPKMQKELVSESDAFSAIPNAWGRQGWTKIHLEVVGAKEFEKAIKKAWELRLKR